MVIFKNDKEFTVEGYDTVAQNIIMNVKISTVFRKDIIKMSFPKKAVYVHG